MKFKFMVLAIAITLGLSAQKNSLHETKYFSFHSNKQLNAHLFLYNKALGCKFGKRPADSLAFYSFKDKVGQINPKEMKKLNSVITFYKDSLLSKDLLFDSTMRDFSDLLVSEGKYKLKLKWQAEAIKNVKLFQPYFDKLYWPAIDSSNKVWLGTYKSEIEKYETTVIPELERIFKTKLPSSKIRVDLSSYATWAGAYSFKNTSEHIIFSSVNRGNQGDQASEVIFHEASHFLVDQLAAEIDKILKTTETKKEVKADLVLWHNALFYTTGYVMHNEFAKVNKEFTAFYKIAKFEDRIPSFKTSVIAFQKYWDPYIKGEIGFETSVKGIVEYMLDNL